jgi:hypothetical protein
MLARFGALPFIKTGCRNQAAAFPVGRSERWFFYQRFGPGIDQSIADAAVLGPGRNQSPMQVGGFVAAVFKLNDIENFLSWRNVIVRLIISQTPQALMRSIQNVHT